MLQQGFQLSRADDPCLTGELIAVALSVVFLQRKQSCRGFSEFLVRTEWSHHEIRRVDDRIRAVVLEFRLEVMLFVCIEGQGSEGNRHQDHENPERARDHHRGLGRGPLCHLDEKRGGRKGDELHQKNHRHVGHQRHTQHTCSIGPSKAGHRVDAVDEQKVGEKVKPEDAVGAEELANGSFDL